MSLAGRERIQEEHGLQRDIGEVVRLLELCRQRFDLALDEDLLEAAIYEENALMARYRYLLRTARGQAEETAQKGRTTCLTPSISEDF